MLQVDVAHRTLPMQGETRNGDAVFVRTADDHACVAVIDALGHGPVAADVADRALACLDASPCDDAVSVLQALHGALRGTRGAAATVCVLRGGALTACGVGNVALRSVGSGVPFVLSPGILGARVQTFRKASARLAVGDRITLYSDGIASSLSLEGLRTRRAEEVCAQLFAAHRKTTDDATLLVLDVLSVG